VTELQDWETQFPDPFIVAIDQLDNDINDIVVNIYLDNYI
jgi:hypothetical protein